MAQTGSGSNTVSSPSAGSAVASRSMVRELGGVGQRLELSFDARTAFDFVISIKSGSEKDSDLLPQDSDWLDRTLSGLPAGVRSDIDTYFGDESLGLAHSLPTLIVQRAEIADAAGLVKAARAMSSEELAGFLLGGLLSKYQQGDKADDIVAGDQQALDDACEPFDAEHRAKLEAFVANRDAELDRMLAVLETWLPAYQQLEPRVAKMIKRDVADRKTDGVTADGVVDLIERTTGGLRWFPEAGVRRVILVPQYFGRPYNYVFNGPDWRLFAYPLSESAVGPSDVALPPQAMVRLYRALGDATRMRILRLLADRDWYLTELATQLELSKPTMKHHLALMRAAGLVTVIEQGGLTYYNLRRERVAEAGIELQHYIS